MNWHPDQTVNLAGRWEENVDMGLYASYRAGGKAKYTYVPASTDDLCAALSQIPQELPVVFVGRSTNMLVTDAGFGGVMILLGEMARLDLTGENLSKIVDCDGDACLSLSAALSSPKAAQLAVFHGLAGLEFLAGIPGTVGGALTMNAGSAGQSTWTHVESITLVDRQGNRFEKGPEDFEIGYREVAPKFDRQAWFLWGHFRLPKGDRTALKEKVDELLAWRKAHQPLQLPSAGSVFRNPVGDSAGRLIESCGLKGFSIGGAMVSPTHANFIVNAGNATATDIVSVMTHVQRVVEAETGVRLVREVRVIGEEPIGEA